MSYYNSSKRSKTEIAMYLGVALLSLLVVCSFAVAISASLSTGYEEIKVVEKVCHHKDGFLVFSENEVFRIDDSVLDGVWNSSDTFRNLQVGERYYIKTRGKRIPFLSFYRKIVEVTLITEIK